MAEIFEYVPQPHAEERKVAGPPTVAAAVAQLHGSGPVGRFNAKFGLRITVIVGTMWCASLFTLLAVVENPPSDWSLQRRREYLDWAVAVVAGCRGASGALERHFDAVLSRGREA
jgi:hypothetical protein